MVESRNDKREEKRVFVLVEQGKVLEVLWESIEEQYFYGWFTASSIRLPYLPLHSHFSPDSIVPFHFGISSSQHTVD